MPPGVGTLGDDELREVDFESGPGHGAEVRDIVRGRAKQGDETANFIKIVLPDEEVIYCIADIYRSTDSSTYPASRFPNALAGSQERAPCKYLYTDEDLTTDREAETVPNSLDEVDEVTQRVHKAARLLHESVWTAGFIGGVVRDYLAEEGEPRSTPVIYY